MKTTDTQPEGRIRKDGGLQSPCCHLQCLTFHPYQATHLHYCVFVLQIVRIVKKKKKNLQPGLQ